jgi:Xaa-Pro aminopeptidase
MRRGLISHSKIELPDAVLDARLARVRAAMVQAHLDALVIYTNNTRPAGVSWLTGFVPYWSEALLVVPHGGEPYLVVALTFRVKSWIERTTRVAEVIHTPRVGLGASQQIAKMKSNAAVGIVDFHGLPTGIADDLRAGGASLTLSDASALFVRLREKADPAEIALAVTAASIAHAALAAADGNSHGTIIAAVEARARGLGAEEIYIASAPDLARDRRFVRVEGEASLGEIFALRASVAYKGVWVRMVRTIGAASAAQAAAERLARAVAQLPSDRGFAGFSSWLVEGCRMAQPLEPLMGSRAGTVHAPAAGALVSVQANMEVDGRSVLIGAPALLGEHGEAASMLVGPLFD